MYRTGALVVSSSAVLMPALAAAAKLVTGVLYVPLIQCTATGVTLSEGLDDCQKRGRELLEASQQIYQVYSHVSKWSPLLDVRILLPPRQATPVPGKQQQQLGSHPLTNHVDVLLSPLSSLCDVKSSPGYQYLLSRGLYELDSKFHQIEIDPVTEGDRGFSIDQAECSTLCSYSDVSLGGTFDNIHNGHRVLLTESALIATSRILVGIADGPLLQTKVLPELIKPTETRISDVRNYLLDVNPWIKHEVVPITDVYGPTAYDSQLNCLVVSPETRRGGEKINAERERKGLKPLAIHVIGVVGEQADSLVSGKLSSSDIRKSMLGTYKTLQGVASHDPSQGPYLIGLTGGIASGKSSILKLLAHKGAYPIDCDKLGHGVYEPGMPAYSKLVEEFGRGILTQTGEVNRKALGLIVFSDQERFEKLNSIVWPEIWKEVVMRIKHAHTVGSKVCIIDAAVMVKAGWHSRVHEIWVAIAPQNDVLRRVIERDNLTEGAARKRIESQMTNKQYVHYANVVFSTQWDSEYTKKQVDTAWKYLLCRLSTYAQKDRCC